MVHDSKTVMSASFLVMKEDMGSLREFGKKRDLMSLEQNPQLFVLLSALAGWVAGDTDKDTTLCLASERENDFKNDPNYEFLQPSGTERYALTEPKYPLLMKYVDVLRDLNWSSKSGDVDVGQDKAHFNEIESENPWIKTLIWNVIGFFVPSDGLIIENVESNFAEEVAIPEYRAFLAVQANNELVHSEMYSRLAQCYVEDIADRNKLFRSIETMPAVRRKVQWAQFWLSHKISFAERLVAYTAVEGILFAASFSIIFWIKDRFPGKLPGLTKSNEWISRDENIHVEAGTALYHHLPHKLPIERIKEIYLSALDVELIFLRSIMPEKGINGLTLSSLEEHVRYMTNFWFELYQDTTGPFELLVSNPDGSVPQPLPEVRRLSRFVKANFFEVRNGNYMNPNLSDQFVDLSAAF